MKPVAKNTAFLTGASIVQKALSFIYFIILSRAFGAHGVGSYTYALSFTTIFAILVDGGFTPVLIREIAAVPESAAATVRRTLLYKAILLVVAVALMAAVGTQLDAARSVWPLIMTAAAVMVFDSFNLTLYGVLRAFHTVSLESIGLLVAQLIAIVFGLSAVVFKLPIIVALIGLGVASMTNSLLASVAAYKKIRQMTPVACSLSHRAFLREALPFGLAGAFARGYSYLDALIIGEIVSVSAVGLYGIANKLTFAFQFVPLALSATLYPAFSAELSGRHESSQEHLRELWLQAERYLMFVGAGIVAMLFSLAPRLLHLYGNAFSEASAVLKVLALSLLASFVSYPVGALLNAARLQKYQTTAMGVTFILNAVFNVLLIPRIGIFGAAIAAWIGNVTLASVGAYFAHTRVVALPWNEFMLALLRACVAAGITSIATIALQLYTPWFVAGALGGVTYILSLLALGGITMKECRSLISHIRRV